MSGKEEAGDGRETSGKETQDADTKEDRANRIQSGIDQVNEFVDSLIVEEYDADDPRLKAQEEQNKDGSAKSGSKASSKKNGKSKTKTSGRCKAVLDIGFSISNSHRAMVWSSTDVPQTRRIDTCTCLDV